jgi:hypothetical protein
MGIHKPFAVRLLGIAYYLRDGKLQVRDRGRDRIHTVAERYAHYRQGDRLIHQPTNSM